jgi:internalin A
MTLLEYASNPSLDIEAVRTIIHLIDWVSRHLNSPFREAAKSAEAELKDSGWIPHIDLDLLAHAYPHLRELTWLNLQSARPDVVNVEPIGFLTNLTGLIIHDNAVTNISSLSSLTRLTKLYIGNNPIIDISPLSSLKELRELLISGVNATDLSPLSDLPELTELTISIDQVPAFQKCDSLESVRYIEFAGCPQMLEGFEYFPELPRILGLVGVKTISLDGIDRFTTLQNITNLSGPFTDLQPLAKLPNLTHVNMYSCNVKSLDCMAEHPELREFSVSSNELINVDALRSLPKLCNARIKSELLTENEISRLQNGLRSWDEEFKTSTRLIEPRMEVSTVTDEQFDYYDVKNAFGVEGWDGNRMMLLSEMDWIGNQIETRLGKFLKEGDDFHWPFQVRYARSATLILYSEKATGVLANVIEQVQDVLCDAIHEWIIYLHTDMRESGSSKPDFQVWVYRDCIQVTEKYVKIVNGLLKG